MPYTFDAIFAVDPNNPANVAKSASITIFDPADPSQAPIAITDPTGVPLPNPITVDAAGMGPAYQHPTLARVGWKGAGFVGYFTSYEGMFNETVAAKVAAQTAASSAVATVNTALAGAVSDAEAAATAATNAAALVGAPADTAIAAAVNGNGETKAALGAAYAGKPDNGAKAVGKGELVLNVKDYGTLGTADDSAVFQAAFNDAGTKKADLICPPGVYTISNVGAPSNLSLRSAGGHPYRFGATGVTLKNKAGSTNPCLVLNGGGITLDGITLDGNGAPGDVLDVLLGFEVRLRNIRIINGAGIGLKIAGCGNATYENIYVDNCGSATLPAVLIASTSLAINTLDVDVMHIERQKNVALQIGSATDTIVPEFLRFSKLHIEAVLDNGGAMNTGGLIEILNGRSISFIDPYLYGGPGPAIRHNQAATSFTTVGGVQVIGGTILGYEPDAAYKPDRLVDLVAGDQFTILGTRLDNCKYGAIRVGTAYGSRVNVGSGVLYTARVPAALEDLRTGTVLPSRLPGHIEVGGHLCSAAGSSPTIAAVPSGAATPTLNPSADNRGNGFFGSSATPAAGAQVTVTFAKPFTTAPVVVLTAGNAATAALGLFVGVTTTNFTVYAANTPGVSQANGTYNFNWLAIG
jgi:hypothetical protein